MMAAGTLQPIRPYWDQRLRSDRVLRFDFFQELRRIGIGGLRRSIRARVAFFFVRKKNGMLRLVTDARETNQMHREPPRSALGGPGALAQLDFSPEAARFAGADASSVDVHCASGDPSRTVSSSL